VLLLVLMRCSLTPTTLLPLMTQQACMHLHQQLLRSLLLLLLLLLYAGGRQLGVGKLLLRLLLLQLLC
jgi:hypothetical protein